MVGSREFDMTTLLIALLLAQVTAVSWEDPLERPRENGRWLCWMYSGKDHSARVIERAESLEHYLNRLPSFDSQVQWFVDHHPQGRHLSGKIETIGTFSGRDVVDILFTVGDRPNPFGKMVLIGKSNSFKPVVWILDEMGVDLSRSSITNVGTREVLFSRCRISGTGNFYLEDYLVFDEKDQIPVNLRPDAVIREALLKVLPKGSGVRKGGGFDIPSLTFVSPVWKDGDGNCCGNGGRIEIKLELNDDRLTVIHTDFDPSFKWN